LRNGSDPPSIQLGQVLRTYSFLLGIFATMVVLLVGGFLYLRLGLMNPRADAPVNPIEKAILGPAMDAAVSRHAVPLVNPLPPSGATLASGMQLYQQHCALCHGDPAHQNSILAQSLYPRPPQFLSHAPDKPDAQNFFIVAHGIRNTGMPAWGTALNSQQRWQIVTFLSRMGNLDPALTMRWQNLAQAPPNS